MRGMSPSVTAEKLGISSLGGFLEREGAEMRTLVKPTEIRGRKNLTRNPAEAGCGLPRAIHKAW